MADIITHRGAATARRPQSFVARIAAALAVWRQRRMLADLPEHLRRDVGLSDAEVSHEITRPFWDLPGNTRF